MTFDEASGKNSYPQLEVSCNVEWRTLNYASCYECDIGSSWMNSKLMALTFQTDKKERKGKKAKWLLFSQVSNTFVCLNLFDLKWNENLDFCNETLT